MIWILGGTSETGKLLQKIKGRLEYIVTVATESGREFLPPGEHVVVARLDAQQMRDFIEEHAITTVVDVTHPYATEASQNARQMCQKNHIPYFRYVRPKSPLGSQASLPAPCPSPEGNTLELSREVDLLSVKIPPNSIALSPEGQSLDSAKIISLPSIQECTVFLQNIKGCVFFTTGSKNIRDFQRVRGQNRFVYRVLPTPASLAECHKQHVEMKDIVAMLGPFSEEPNIALFREYQADYVVMKDSGWPGGTPEKLKACLKLGITAVLIGRNDEEGISDLDVLAEMICI